MPIPLTKKKYNWAKNRDVNLQGLPLNYNAGIEAKYVKRLKKIVRLMTQEVRKEILSMYKSEIGQEYFKQQKKSAMDASFASQVRILLNALSRKFFKSFNDIARPYAESMINQTLKASQSSLHSSLEKLSGGLSLKTSIVPKGLEDVIKASIDENVSLIKSIPEQYFKNITGSVMRSITSGEGLKELLPQLQKYGGQTERRATNLALDQTRKAYTSINKQRLQALNVKRFKWIHSGGSQHPRKSHVAISGQIFSFENILQEQAALNVPPNDRGLPGYPVNCKCTLSPVIEFNDED